MFVFGLLIALKSVGLFARTNFVFEVSWAVCANEFPFRSQLGCLRQRIPFSESVELFARTNFFFEVSWAVCARKRISFSKSVGLFARTNLFFEVMLRVRGIEVLVLGGRKLMLHAYNKYQGNDSVLP